MLSTWVEISRSALSSNIQELKQLQRQGQFGVVVKSNAYGHDMLVIASLVENMSEVAWLCTAGIEEALLLRSSGCSKKILAMAYTHDGDLKEAINHHIDVMVDDIHFAQELHVIAARSKTKARVHLKVDTGLSRRGVLPKAVVSFARMIKSQCSTLDLVGIFTHLSDTSSADTKSMIEQLTLFNRVLEDLTNVGIRIPCTHAFSSGALTTPLSTDTYPFEYAMARIGTHVYGLWKSERQRQSVLTAHPGFFLRPVLTWKARVMDVIQVPQGTGIGYSHTFVTQGPSRIALIPVGYADGYPRRLSHKASIIIEGHDAPLVGTISMNFLAVDVTQIPSAQRGSCAILMGEPAVVRLNDLALQAGTINNELLTHINPSIKRIVVE